MRRLLAGMIVGALAMSAINNNKSTTKSYMKKGKRAIMKKFDDVLNV